MIRLTWLAVTFGCAALGACNVVGPAFVLIHGPEKVRRVCTLDASRRTVVFVSDLNGALPRQALRLHIAQSAERTLLANRATRDMVAAESALAAVRDTADSPVPISDIGRAVGADVVVYATVDAFGLSPDGQTLAPFATLRVKVVDAVNQTRLWPDSEFGHLLSVRMPPPRSEFPVSAAQRRILEDDLAEYAGLCLARLFFDHERPTGVVVPD